MKPDISYYIGAISGTSVDAIDCALLAASSDGLSVQDTYSGKYPEHLRQRILALCASPTCTLADLGQLDVEIGRHFAMSVLALLQQTGLKASDISAIGSHGQTVFHAPDAPFPFSTQLGDPNTIAQLTGITTVADFRRRDMAAGGQGAPLAPLFHQHFFFDRDTPTAVLNIGGIANLTVLSARHGESPIGYDTGPGNVLMDSWVQSQFDMEYDKNGQIASQGDVLEHLLAAMLAEPYFARPAPKSTGRELFNLDWLQKHLQGKTPYNLHDSGVLANIQRTLLELTVESVARALATHTPVTRLAVCGGGVHNSVLMHRLQQRLGPVQVMQTAELGLNADWVEAATFAWLASQTLEQQVVDCGRLTGARQPVILGGVYWSN